MSTTTPTTGFSRWAARRSPASWTEGPVHQGHLRFRHAMATDFVLTLLSRDPPLIRAADRAGVDRLGIDIERLGKRQRQGHIANARISDHELEDLRLVAANARRAAI